MYVYLTWLGIQLVGISQYVYLSHLVWDPAGRGRCPCELGAAGTESPPSRRTVRCPETVAAPFPAGNTDRQTDRQGQHSGQWVSHRQTNRQGQHSGQWVSHRQTRQGQHGGRGVSHRQTDRQGQRSGQWVSHRQTDRVSMAVNGCHTDRQTGSA